MEVFKNDVPQAMEDDSYTARFLGYLNRDGDMVANPIMDIECLVNEAWRGNDSLNIDYQSPEVLLDTLFGNDGIVDDPNRSRIEFFNFTRPTIVQWTKTIHCEKCWRPPLWAENTTREEIILKPYIIFQVSKYYNIGTELQTVLLMKCFGLGG